MFGLKNSNWHGDAIDWIGDAIEAIGYHCGFDVGEVTLNVKNYRVAIPSNMESIEYILHEGHRLPLGVDESDYGFVRYKEGVTSNILSDNETLSLGKEIDALNALREMDPAIPGVLEQIENTLFQINTILGSKYLASDGVTRWRHHFYNIESECQYIKTSFDEGTILVKCRRFRVDKNGLPIIVNTYKYKEAISWFIMSRLMLQGYPHPELKSWREAWVMFDGGQTEHGYEPGFKAQAQNEPKIFTIDQMERFKQRWTSVKRDADAQHEIYIQ